MRKTIRAVALLALLAASVATSACSGNLYTGVDSAGPWTGPSHGRIGGGALGYPF